jgi:hypothetical protein
MKILWRQGIAKKSLIDPAAVLALMAARLKIFL